MLDELIDALAEEPPVFRLPEAVHSHTRAYMPAPLNKKLIYDAFLRLERDAEVVAAWPCVELASDQRHLVAHLLKRIGYFGRSESWAEGCIADDWEGDVNAHPRSTDLHTLPDSVPVDIVAPLPPRAWGERRSQLISELGRMPKSKRAGLEMTLPYRLADALAIDTGEWQRTGWSSPPPLRQIVYDRPPVGPLPKTTRSRGLTVDRGRPGKPQVARYVLAGRPHPRIEDALRIAEIARWALIYKKDGIETPIELLGRDANGPLRDDPEHAHAFYLPEDADRDGFIDHLIVYCRRGFSDDARRRLDSLTRLWLAHGRADEGEQRGRKEWRVALEDIAEPEAFPESPVLAQASMLDSVTPYLKPRFDKRRATSFAALVDSYRTQILDEWGRRFPAAPPPDVSPLTARDNDQRFAMVNVADGRLRQPLAFSRTRSRRGGRQPDAAGGFFRLSFEQPVRGPIAIGWGCHFGLGLFVPSR